jgi:predicted PurR-regulated permease PerM
MRLRGNEMSAIFHFVGHTLAAMVKGFVFTGVVAAILCFLALVVASPDHEVSMGIGAVFSIVIAVLAAFLGAAAALIYHLSHIEELRHLLARASAARDSAHRETMPER